MLFHTQPVADIAMNNKYIISASYDKSIILWDKYTNQAIYQLNHDNLVTSIQCTSCNQFLVSGSADHSVRIWSLSDTPKLFSVNTEHCDDIESISISPNNKLIASASRDNNIKIINMDGVTLKNLNGHTSDVISVGFLSNSLLLSSGDDGTLRIWNINDNTNKILFESEFEVDCFTIINSRIFIIGCDDGKIYLLKDHIVIDSIHAHFSGVKSIEYNKYNNTVISSSYDNTTKVWSLKNNCLALFTQYVYPASVWARNILPISEKKILMSSYRGKYAELELDTSCWTLSENVSKGINGLVCIKDVVYSVNDSGEICIGNKNFSISGDLSTFIVHFSDKILTGGLSGKLYSSSICILDIGEPLNNAITIKTDNNKYLLLVTYNGSLIKISEKFEILDKFKLSTSAIKSIAYNDGLIAIVLASGEVKVYDTYLYNEVANIRNHELIANDIISHENLHKTFISVARDKKIIIHKVGDEAKIIQTSHTKSIKTVSCDGKIIVTGDYLGTVKVHSLETNKEIKSFKVSFYGIGKIIYCSNRNRFIISTYDGKIFYLDSSLTLI